VSILNKLNDKQRKAAEKIDGPVLILAGAGSGKTRTVTYRIAHMVEELGIPPYKILAVTFTNKAAKEMRERVEDLIGPEARRVTISTFHSFGVKLLRMFANKVGYESNFNIYDSDDQKRIVKKLLKDLGRDKIKPAGVVSQISKFKEDDISPEEAKREAYIEELIVIADVYAKYETELKKNNAMDFSDLLLNTNKLLEQPEILDKIQDKYEYIMVDEYQDTNNIQYQIVTKIARKNKNLCVVGDEDQSIYGFRGANIQNILDFEKDYKDAFVVKLEQNYRSTGHILEAANNVIKLNKSSKGKKLWTEKEMGKKLSLYNAHNARDEARFVLDEIVKMKLKGYNYKDFTILYRTNAQSRIFEESFLREGISYKIFGGLQFYQRKEIKDILSYLRLINNLKDNLSFSRIINVPKRKIGAKTIEKIENFANEKNLSLLEALKYTESIEKLTPAVRVTLMTFYDMFKEIIEEAEFQTASEIFDLVLEKSGYISSLDTDPSKETRIQNIEELRGSIQELEKELGFITVGEYLENTALVAATDDLNEDTDYVKLMTVHNSKGLEFPVVFLVGMEDEIFPNAARVEFEEDELEEERRLCYVAITRAEEKLFMSHSNEREVYGRTSYFRKISRFIDEIPENLLQVEINPILQREERKIKAEKKSIENFNPFKKMKKIEEEDEDLPFKSGEKVNHKKFGMGIVKGVEDKKRVVVQFAVGTKKIPLVLADKFLTKI